MKDFFKKTFSNIIYVCIINCCLFFGFIWALFGVAFNDTGVQYNTIIEALPTILFGIAPIVIGSIICIFVLRKKKDFNVYFCIISQLIIIIGWVLFYIVNYVPNSSVNLYFKQKQHNRSVSYQNKINERVIKELNKDYLLIDSIEEDKKKINLYFNKNTKKLIVEFSINDEKNYNIIDSYKKNSIVKEKIAKYNSNSYLTFDEVGNMSICFEKECYYSSTNCIVSGNSYNYADALSVYSLSGKSYILIDEYKKMVKNSVSNGEGIYYLNDDEFVNIELIDGGIKINGDLDNKKNYTWVIKRNNEIVLERVAKNNELIFERDLTKKEFYDIPGKYELYLQTYIDDIGYTKISNSVNWERQIKDYDFVVMKYNYNYEDKPYLILEKDGRNYYYQNQNFGLLIEYYNNDNNLDKSRFQDILENNKISFDDILKKANKSEMYEDGGSTIYFYDDFNIMVCNNLSGNNHIFIGDKTVGIDYCK